MPALRVDRPSRASVQASAETSSVPVVACEACYSLVRSYPRPGRAKPGRFNPKNAALVAPGSSVLLADLAVPLPFQTRKEACGRTAFLAGVVREPPRPPFMVVVFGKNPAIQRGLRICFDDDSIEIGGADRLHVSRAELARVQDRLRDAGLDWELAVRLLKARAAVFDAPVHRRTTAQAVYEKDVAKLHNSGAPAVLDALPSPGTDLYRVMCWHARSQDEEENDAA